MEYLKLSQIEADKNQPRRYFNAEKMRALTESIKREGIISPLVVEKVGDKYLLLDGERRFRASKELHLEKVPVVIESPRNAVERLVRQFTVQEQHEAWTPVEKAVAIGKLAEELGLTLSETCKLLNVTTGDTRRYVAFAQVVDKEGWIRSELPLTFADNLKSLRHAAIRISENKLKKEFTRTDDKRLEKRFIQGVLDGSIKRRTDSSKLIDAWTKEPKTLPKWLDNEKTTAQGLFLETGAQGAYALRNLMYAANYVYSHGGRFLEYKDIALSPIQVDTLKKAKVAIDKVLDLVD